MQQSHTFASPIRQHSRQSLQKSMPAQTHRQRDTADRKTTTERMATHNNTYKKLAVLCYVDQPRLMVNHPPAVGFQIKFCGESPALRVAAKRYSKFKT